MRTFKINGKSYTPAAFSFNTIADLDEMGLSIQDVGKKQLSFIRGYFAICSGLDIETAGKEIEQHIINGGSLDAITSALTKEVEESDFFQSLTKKAKAETTESKAE